MIKICKGNTLKFTSKVTSSDYLKFRHNYQLCLTGQKYNQKKQHSLWRTPKAHCARYTNVSVFKFQCICFLDSWINLTCNWNLTQGFHSKRENKINSQSWFFWTLHQGGILFSLSKSGNIDSYVSPVWMPYYFPAMKQVQCDTSLEH